MKENLNMDKSFKEKLDGFSAAPPSHVLKNVMGQMAALKRKKRIAMLGWVSAAAVIVLAFMAGWYFNNNTRLSPTNLAETTQESITEKSKEHVTDSNPESTRNEITENNNQQSIESNDEPIKSVNENNIIDKNLSEIKTLLAKNTEINVNADEQQESVRQKIYINLISNMNAVFEDFEFKPELVKRPKKSREFDLIETERILLAENAKNYSTEKSSEGIWKVGAQVSPGYSSHQAAHSTAYSNFMTGATSSGNGNVGAGLSIQYKTGKRLRVESGIHYSQNGQKSGNSYQLFARAEYDALTGISSEKSKSMGSNAIAINNGQMHMNSTAGIIKFNQTPKGAQIYGDLESFNVGFSNSLVTSGEYSQVFDFIEIPLYLRYKVVDKKVDVELVGGMNAGVIVGNNAYIENDFGLQNVGSTQDISAINMSGTLGLGLNYGISKHISFAMEPRINYYLNSINKNPAVDFRPYRLGVYTGLYYEF